MARLFKAAAVQAIPGFLDLKASVAKTIHWIDKAAAEGCKLIAFPEAWIPGYPYYIWMGAPAWTMKFVGRYFENCLVIDSAEMRAIQDAAKRNNIMVALGHSERAGGSLYLGQALIGFDGTLLSSRRKLKPTHVERTVYGDGTGVDLTVQSTSLGRIGQLCCWEHLQPLSKYALYSQNEEIHCAAWPTFCVYPDQAYALGATVNLAASRTYAVEGQCYVIAATMVTDQAILDACMDFPEQKGFMTTGGGYSMIFGPDGRELAPFLDPHTEGLVIAEINLDMIPYAKAVADPAGHYSRPDVTRLWLNRAPARPVIYADQALPAAEAGEVIS
jgi:predicted amidohydrolase